MTDIELKIDQEVGRDTEQVRVTFLKFVALGREAALAEAGLVTTADMQAAVDLAKSEVLAKVYAIMHDAGDKAAVVEADEKSQLAAISALKDEGPIKAEIVSKVEALIADIDAKHTAIVHARDAALKALGE